MGKISAAVLQLRKEKIEKDKQIKILNKIFFMKQQAECCCFVCGCEWKTQFSNLYYGTGCPKCKSKQASIRALRTEDEFNTIKQSLFDRGIILNLNYIDYKGDKQRCVFGCKSCGKEWETVLGYVINETGCIFCAQEKIKTAHLRTKEQFETDIQDIFLKKQIIVNINYDQYIKGNIKVPCVCNKCGHVWDNKIDALKSSSGCPRCKAKQCSDRSYKTKEQFNEITEEKSKIFEFKSDYDYYKKTKKCIFVCLECGHLYEELLLKVSKRKLCKKCLKEHINCGYKKPENIFLEDLSILREQNIFVSTSYSEYKNAKTKLDCKCLKCGREWRACLNSLLGGSGCLQCSLKDSSLEKDFLSLLNDLEIKNIVVHNRELLGRKEIDFYLPDYKIGFELHGLYWHSEKFEIGKKGNIQEKFLLASKSGIRLYQFFEDEVKSKSELIKLFVAYKINNAGKTINTRKCYVVEMNSENKQEIKKFVNKNHISGWVNCKFAFALMYDGEIVSVISFRRPFTNNYKNTLEIARFCSDVRFSVPGAFGKLYKYFINQKYSEGIDKILSYADLRFGDGGIYLKNGFDFVGKTDPNYFYTDFNSRLHRFKFRARNGKSEKQITEEAGVVKIYDAGSYIFLKNIIKQ